MNRIWQAILIVSVLGLSWLGMMIAHEVGHVLAAWTCREKVFRVVLHPLAISRTETSHDKHPLLVVWGGPLLGSFLPLILLGLVKRFRASWAYLVQFFAGFCLIANGAYLGAGSFSGVGDAGDLLRFGARQRTLIAFGLIAAPLGLWLWDGLGPHFGLGEAKGRVDHRAAIRTLCLLLVVVLVEVLLGSR
jgi:hypothetical protein